MKNLIALSAIILHACMLNAQDKLYKPDGEVLEGKILEVTAREIKYRKSSIPDGPVYTVSRADVMMVVYENGEHEVFSVQPQGSEPATASALPQKPVFKRKRVLGMDLFQHYYGNASFFIERIKSPIYGMRFTFYVNHKEKNRAEFPIQYGFSINPKFFVYNHEKVHVFIGHSIHWGFSKEHMQYSNYWGESMGESTNLKFHTLNLIEPGVSINPVKQLDITLYGGAGIRSTVNNDFDGDYGLAWRVGISIGGKF